MLGITRLTCALVGALMLTVGTVAPNLADANERHRPGFRPGYHKPWPGYRPNRPGLNKPWLPPFRPPAYNPSYNRPRPPIVSYFRHTLPKIATFSVIAGATYAIVNNLFYKRQGDQYVYVQQPPVQQLSVQQPINTVTTTTVTTAPPSYSYGSLGTVVQGLPAGASSVVVNGASFYVAGGIWYAPMVGTNQYIVVSPQA